MILIPELGGVMLILTPSAGAAAAAAAAGACGGGIGSREPRAPLSMAAAAAGIARWGKGALLLRAAPERFILLRSSMLMWFNCSTENLLVERVNARRTRHFHDTLTVRLCQTDRSVRVADGVVVFVDVADHRVEVAPRVG